MDLDFLSLDTLYISLTFSPTLKLETFMVGGTA